MARRAYERGFTIVEAVVASAVLATGLIALAHVTAVATSAAAHARTTTRATLAATQKIEELRANTFTAGPVDATDVVDARFVRRWRITALPGGSAAAITVEVTPLSRTVRPIRIETIRAMPRNEAAP